MAVNRLGLELNFKLGGSRHPQNVACLVPKMNWGHDNAGVESPSPLPGVPVIQALVRSRACRGGSI